MRLNWLYLAMLCAAATLVAATGCFPGTAETADEPRVARSKMFFDDLIRSTTGDESPDAVYSLNWFRAGRSMLNGAKVSDFEQPRLLSAGFNPRSDGSIVLGVVWLGANLKVTGVYVEDSDGHQLAKSAIYVYPDAQDFDDLNLVRLGSVIVSKEKQADGLPHLPLDSADLKKSLRIGLIETDGAKKLPAIEAFKFKTVILVRPAKKALEENASAEKGKNENAGHR